MTTAALVLHDTYLDSVLLLGLTRTMADVDGVEWSAALMGTPPNLETLRAEGVDAGDLAGVAANDLVLAARGRHRGPTDAALALARTQAHDGVAGGRTATRAPGESRPRTLEEAAALVDANVAVISVPGPYATLEAHKALTSGLHVLLFSDNVSLAAEVGLKERAAGLGRLVMGPGAGTAMLGGTGLGFANAVRPGGRVGVLAAAGTGAQEVMALLDRWGPGASQVVGLGGRDLSEAVGGRAARLALELLAADPASEALLLVSKPPARQVAAAVLAAAPTTKPLVAALVGLSGDLEVPSGVTLATSLEGGALAAVDLLGTRRPDLGPPTDWVLDRRCASLEPGRRAVRGLFSGGTLCYESIVLLSRFLGPVHSNTPLRKDWGLPAPAGAHVCLDLGEEEFTRGRPHPMIDPEARAERIVAAGSDRDTAVVLIDVVLGYGSHPDPASVLAPLCAGLTARPGGPAVVAYVLGTGTDPQGYEAQRQRFEAAGCLVPETAARATLLAAALAGRRPELAEAAA
ncbi:MAG: protein FdrA [Acidimicrobiales bacterium]